MTSISGTKFILSPFVLEMSAPVNVTNLAISGLTTLIGYPTGYAKTLIQLGHEPISPVRGRNIWGKERFYYPNAFKYAGYIWTTDGFLGMYKGVFPAFLGGRLSSAVEGLTLAKLKEGEEQNPEGGEEEMVDWIKGFCLQTSQKTISRCAGIIVSQPFQVIMIRQIGQFVGGEKQYDGLFGAISEIYQTEGISGFFSGLIPRILGEVIQIWVTTLISHLINKYVIQSKEVQVYMESVCGVFVSQFTYPFSLVSNVMAVSGADLVASTPPRMPPYYNWRECWKHLKENNQLKRGSKYFFREYAGPMIYREGRRVPAIAMF